MLRRVRHTLASAPIRRGIADKFYLAAFLQFELWMEIIDR